MFLCEGEKDPCMCPSGCSGCLFCRYIEETMIKCCTQPRNMFLLQKNRILWIRWLDASDCIITVLIPFLAMAYILGKKSNIYFKMLSDEQHRTDYSRLLSLVIRFMEKKRNKNPELVRHHSSVFVSYNLYVISYVMIFYILLSYEL